MSFKEPVLLDLRPALLHERDRLCSKTRLEVDDIVVKPYIERNIINACHGMGDMESSPWFDADDLGLGEQLANVTHGQAVEQVHQDDDGDEDEEDEEGEVEEGERVAAVNGQVRELQLADEHGESLEDARPWLVKVIHPVLVFRVVTNKALQEFNPDFISFICNTFSIRLCFDPSWEEIS